MATPKQAAHQQQAGEGAHEVTHFVVPLSLYYKVFAALMVLLVLTLVAAAFDLGALNLPIALLIAVAKAALVFCFFMHLWWTTRLVRVFAWGALFWLAIMFVLTLADYLTRGQ